MRKFRGHKKSQNNKTDDPEKVAEQKLAFFSDEPLIINNQNSQRWVHEQQNKAPQSQQKQRIKSNKDSREISKNNFRRKFLLMKEESSQNVDLKKYCRIYCNEQNIQSFKIFPQKKLLSLSKKLVKLASYMLFDKRKQSSSNQQAILSMHEAKKIELARLKKLLIPKYQRKRTFSEEKVFQKVESNPNYHVKHNFKNCSLSQFRKPSFDQGSNSNKKSESAQSLLQVSRVFSSIIRRKQVSNLSVERYHQSYSVAKKRLEDSKYIESSMKSNKVKLHQHFEKFAF